MHLRSTLTITADVVCKPMTVVVPTEEEVVVPTEEEAEADGEEAGAEPEAETEDADATVAIVEEEDSWWCT